MTFIIDHTLKVIMKVINVYYNLVDLFILLNITANREGGYIDLLKVQVIRLGLLWRIYIWLIFNVKTSLAERGQSEGLVRGLSIYINKG
jgi:hypothetical protein